MITNIATVTVPHFRCVTSARGMGDVNVIDELLVSGGSDLIRRWMGNFVQSNVTVSIWGFAFVWEC